MSRIHIHRISEGNVQIQIKSFADKISKSQTIFLSFGIVCLLFSIIQIFLNEKIFIKTFLFFWSIVWIFFLIKIWNVVKWRRFGNETIKIDKDNLVLEEKFPFKTKEQIFKLADVNLTYNDCSISESKGLFRVHPGILNIEDRNHNIIKTFGKYLTTDELTLIKQELQLLDINLTSNELVSDEKTSTIENNKYLKKYINNLQKKVFIICLLPAFLYNYFDLRNKNENENEIYFRLKENGIITTVNSVFQSHWDADYYYYYFMTKDGKKIEKSGKCGNEETFNKDYKNLKVIYNPVNPNEFMEYPDFIIYSTKYPVLWLIISTLFYSLFASTLFMMIYIVFNGNLRSLVFKQNYITR